MASRAVQALLASRHERSRPHRIVVRVGAASAWIAAAIYLAAGAFTGDDSLVFEAAGPTLAATLLTIQVLLGKEDAGVALFGTGLIVTIWYSIFGDEGTVIPAGVALVLISAVGMLFVAKHRVIVAGTLAVALFAIPFVWQLPADQQVQVGSIMGLSFAMAHLILTSIQTTTTALQARYQMLFEQSPSALVEEDWSEAIAYVRSEYSGKPTQIRQFLLAYPTVVERAVGQARIVRANDAALSLLEISNPARFLGYRDPKVVTEENIEAFVSALVCLYEGGTTWEREVPIRSRAGELRWVLSRSVDTSANVAGSSIIVGLADITPMKSRHEAMSEVVRTKDAFIANVSHELRTPLTAVIGLTSELASGELDDDESSEMLQLVASQAAEMFNIVDDLLVAARAEVGSVQLEIQRVDLHRELRATLDGLAIDAAVPEEPLPLVSADPNRVRQILRNLLTNAERYGGPDLRVVTGVERDFAWMEVRDDGEGIPDEEAARIFEPYVTSGGRESVGLGLAVARQLAELMGGTLIYERRDSLSVFRLDLPLSDCHERVLASHIDVT